MIDQEREIAALPDEPTAGGSSATLDELLQRLGFTSADELLQHLTAAEQEMEALRQEAEALRQALAAEHAARLTALRDAALRQALRDTDDADSVIALVRQQFGAAYEALVGEDGAVDMAAARQLAEQAAKRWPGLFRPTAPGVPSNADGFTPRVDLDKVMRNVPKLKL